MNKLTELLKLSAPLSAAQLSHSAMIFCDTILFGLLGVAELAGAGLGAGIFHFLIIVATGLFSAVGNEVAIHVGSHQREEIGRVVKAGLRLAVITAAILGGIIYCTPFALPYAGQSAIAVTHATEYLHWAILISLPAFVFMVLRGLASGMGNTTSIMRISLLGIVVNVPLSYCLMTGLGPLPEMGVSGVAFGTFLVHCVMCLALWKDLQRHAEIREVLEFLPRIKLQRKDFQPYLTLGVPIMLAWLMEAGLFTVATLMAGTLGLVALAAHQIAVQAATLSFNCYIGIAQGTAIRVGQCFGRGDLVSARQYAWTGTLLGACFCITAAILFILVPEHIVGLFLLGEDGVLDNEVLQLGVKLILVAAVFQLVDASQVIMMNNLRALRVGVSPTVTALVGYWGVGAPAAWWLLQDHGVVGLWFGLGLGLATTAIGLTTLFESKIKQLTRNRSSLEGEGRDAQQAVSHSLH